MKLLSLFDGSGGFPLAGAMCGITPVAASEVEPYPIAVTRSRFPNMKHLGDVSKINGAEIEPVDIITFGSPCQDMSVAGKQAGIKHADNGDDETTRSGLFMEAVRIIKEMRGATNGRYPRFAVWENVPGAFSSNKGEDFRIVLDELIKTVEPTAVMPEVPKKGWAYADCYFGDGWSLAYRVLDAQYIRTAQRRRRIYLVLDLGGQCARQILFEREGLRGYSAPCGTPRKRTSSDTESCVGADDCLGADQYNAVVLGDTVSTLGVNCGMSHGRQCVLEPMAYGIGSYDSNGMKSSNPHSGIYEADTARTLDPNGGNPACHQGGIAIVEPKTYGFPLGFRPENVRCYEETATTLCNGTRAGFCNGVVVGVDFYNQSLTGDKSKTLNSKAVDSDHVPCTVYSVENHPNDSRVKIDDEGKVQALTGRMGTGGGNVPMVMHPFCKAHRAASADDATTWKHGEVANTLNTFDLGEVRANELVVEEKPIAIDRAYFNQGKNALYEPQTYDDGTNPTLVAKGPSAVAYSIGNGQVHDAMSPSEEVCKTLDCMHEPMKVCIAQPPRYIVRRLTPTECARLQGFADRWGDIKPKSDFTDEEYRFWLEVRNTHAEINGKAVKDYTKKQMLTWYNKLHTDSAEYKLWGNGIALPCALYVMEGIAEAMEGEQCETD